METRSRDGRPRPFTDGVSGCEGLLLALGRRAGNWPHGLVLGRDLCRCTL